jgi:hypothetical protein
MAGLGKKTWATDDILTAVDLNGYLADQVTMVFASSAARTAGITFPSEGMVTYLSDSNSLWHYTGTTWVNIPTAAVGTANYAVTAGTAVFATNATNATTAANATKVSNQTIFIQAGTPTANATSDLWFWGT